MVRESGKSKSMAQMANAECGANYISQIPSEIEMYSTVRLGMEVLRHSGDTITREHLLAAAAMLGQSLFKYSWALGKL